MTLLGEVRYLSWSRLALSTLSLTLSLTVRGAPHLGRSRGWLVEWWSGGGGFERLGYWCEIVLLGDVIVNDE